MESLNLLQEPLQPTALETCCGQAWERSSLVFAGILANLGQIAPARLARRLWYPLVESGRIQGQGIVYSHEILGLSDSEPDSSLLSEDSMWNPNEDGARKISIRRISAGFPMATGFQGSA